MGERGDCLGPSDSVSCCELDDDQKAMVERFVEVCKRRGLKVNAGRRGGAGNYRRAGRWEQREAGRRMG